MLKAEASERNPRQAGLLAYGSGTEEISVPRSSNNLPATIENRSQWRHAFESLADHSGGPATDLHRFPYCLSSSEERT
jgi:hypothetical protein